MPRRERKISAPTDSPDEPTEPRKKSKNQNPPDTSADEDLSPAEAWPFPHGTVSDDDFADVRLIRVADTFAGESVRIRRLQTYVLIFGAAVVAVLLAFLGYSICKGFDGHLTAAEQMLVKAASRTALEEPSAASAPAESASRAVAASTPEHQPKGSKGKAKTEAKSAIPAPAAAASSPDASLHELLSTSVKAIASTTVAVIWVLVIAIAVITIAIARAVLSLKPQGLDSSADGEKDANADSSAIALPGLEFAKEVVKLIGETAKSVGK